MDELIEALTILKKYLLPGNVNYPTLCCHDELHVCATNDVTPEERERLDVLGFHWSESDDNWYSFKYGSC